MRSLQYAALVIAACLTGVLATKPAISYVMARTVIRNGVWETAPDTGNADANLYERAAIAIAGLYALDKREAVYYTAFKDAEGQWLDGRCNYLLSGQSFPARWWSLTLYGADNFLVDNTAGIYSRHANNLTFEPNGSYLMRLSSQSSPGNWLPAPADGHFSVTLRLYNPEPTVYENLATLPLPAIHRENCR